jgi:hypothetical protein
MKEKESLIVYGLVAKGRKKKVHPIEPSDFKIVTSANSNHEILIKESLLIAQTKPWLNNNVRSFPLTLF